MESVIQIENDMREIQSDSTSFFCLKSVGAQRAVPLLRFIDRLEGPFMRLYLLPVLIFLSFLLETLLLSSNAHAFEVTAQVDRNRITINDTLVLKIVFQDGEGDIDTSRLTDFEIISQSSSSNISIINGNYSKTISTIYRLVPRREGRLQIPAFEVRHKGKRYTTKLIPIEVTAANVRPKASRDIFIEAGLSSTSPYVGEQVVYQLRLFSAIRFSNATLQQPDFTGFTAKEAGDRQNYETTIDGRGYRVIAVNYVLIPETPGEIEIDPAVIICDVPVKGGRSNDPFSDPFFSNNFFSFGRSEKRRLSTGPLSVKINPLPEYRAGRPPFSGVVGHVAITAELDRDRLAAGESMTLTLTLEGKGNLMDAQSPELTLPDGVKVYEDAPVDEISLSAAGYSGKKVFKKAIVPVTPGNYTIDSISFSYFDVDQGRYEIVTTSAIPFHVTPAENQVTTQSGGGQKIAISSDGTPLPDAGSNPIRKKERVQMTGKDILGLKEGKASLTTGKSLSFSIFTALFFLPSLLFILLKLFLMMGKKEASLASTLEKRAKETLSQAEKCVTGQSDEEREIFLKSLHGALIKKVLSKAGRKGETLTAEEIRSLLSHVGCASAVPDEVNALLSEIESARYGGREDDAAYRDRLLSRTKTLFQTIGMVTLMIGTLFFAFPEMGRCQPDQGRQFYDAVDAYREGRYEDAAAQFERIVASGVKNPRLYYNIGNAYLKAGKLGEAVLWYERAQKGMPFDPDLKFNLTYAEELMTDKVEESFDLSRLLFFWRDYLPTEALKYTAVIFSMLFFSYAGVRTVRRKRVLTLAGAIGCILWIAVGVTAFYAVWQDATNRRAVILSARASVRSGTSGDATELFVLHAGTRVKVETVREEYLKIIFSKGKIGWVSRDDAEMI